MIDRSGLVQVLPDHEKRICAQERFIWMIVGAVILINGLAAYFEYLVQHR